MIKAEWSKEKGKYLVAAFGEVHEFDERDQANDYVNECNDLWFRDPESFGQPYAEEAGNVK